MIDPLGGDSDFRSSRTFNPCLSEGQRADLSSLPYPLPGDSQVSLTSRNRDSPPNRCHANGLVLGKAPSRDELGSPILWDSGDPMDVAQETKELREQIGARCSLSSHNPRRISLTEVYLGCSVRANMTIKTKANGGHTQWEDFVSLFERLHVRPVVADCGVESVLIHFLLNKSRT